MTRSENEKAGRGNLDGFLVPFYCQVIKCNGTVQRILQEVDQETMKHSRFLDPFYSDTGRRGAAGKSHTSLLLFKAECTMTRATVANIDLLKWLHLVLISIQKADPDNLYKRCSKI